MIVIVGFFVVIAVIVIGGSTPPVRRLFNRQGQRMSVQDLRNQNAVQRGVQNALRNMPPPQQAPRPFTMAEKLDQLDAAARAGRVSREEWEAARARILSGQ
jgi:hypothetical protein